MIKRYVIILFLLSASISYARTRISLYLDSNVEFDLSLLTYPNVIFPAYYYPTLASPTNRQGIFLQLGYQRRPPGGHTVSNIYLATRGRSNFSSTVLLDQLFYAPDGEPLPSAGVDPPGGRWRAFTTLFQQIEQFSVTGANRTFNRPQDYIFQSEVDDEPTNASTTIYYRVYGL